MENKKTKTKTKKKKKKKKNWAFYAVFWKVTQQSSYDNRSPDLFSEFCVHVSHELLWQRKSVFYIVRILSISYFCHFLWTHGHFSFLETYGISMFSFPRN